MSRILINHVSPMPNKLTGISVYTWKIVEALHRHGRHDYVLATNWDADRLPPEIRALGMEIVHRSVPRNETRAVLRNTIELPRLRRRLGASLVFHPQPTSSFSEAGRSTVVIHDLYRVTHRALYPRAQQWQWRLATAPAFGRAARLVCVSEATRQALIAAYPRLSSRSAVVHEASPIEVSAADQAAGGRGDYGLMVANVTPNKNVALLFAALDLLAGEGWQPRIVLVGRDDMGALDELRRRYPRAAVEMPGSVNDAELRRLYAGAGVYINTSLVEGFCLPVLEAQTCGTPVICADIPVLREVAGEGAMFVDPHAPRQLADALRAMLNDAATHARMRDRAIANAQRFGWPKAARETEAVFDAILASRGEGAQR